MLTSTVFFCIAIKFIFNIFMKLLNLIFFILDVKMSFLFKNFFL
jgi:hypothetical protein